MHAGHLGRFFVTCQGLAETLDKHIQWVYNVGRKSKGDYLMTTAFILDTVKAGAANGQLMVAFCVVIAVMVMFSIRKATKSPKSHYR